MSAVRVPPLRLAPLATTPSLAPLPECGGAGNGDTPRGRILKDGWMEKRGGRVKKWRRRYFLLVSEPRELRYFDGEKLKGSIDMNQVKAIAKAKRSWTKTLEHCYSFEMHTAKRVYYISCDSEEELLSWMAEIRQLLTTRPPGQGASSTPCGLDGGRSRAESVSGAESGGEGDESASLGESEGTGVRIYMTSLEDSDDEESEGEELDESEIFPEYSETETTSTATATATPTTALPPSPVQPTMDRNRLAKAKAIIADSLIKCQLQLTEERQHLQDRASTMSKEELIRLVKKVKLLNEELGLVSSSSGLSTPRSRPTTPRTAQS